MKLKYQGRHTGGVVIPTPAGDVFIAFGAVADVDDDIASKLLVEQPDAFKKVTATKKAADSADIEPVEED